MYKFEKLGLNIWDDVFMNAKALSEKARLLYCYLLTCPLSNIAGVFQITNERIAFDLGYSIEELKEALRALRRARKAFRVGRYIIIVDAPLYLKKRLKTVLKSFATIIEALPIKIKIKLHLVGYHWADLETNIHTQKVVEKVRCLAETYKKSAKDIEAIKLFKYKDKNEKKKDYSKMQDDELIELNLANFIDVSKGVFNRNKPIVNTGSIANYSEELFFDWQAPKLLLPYYSRPIDNELGGGNIEIHYDGDYDASDDDAIDADDEESHIKKNNPVKENISSSFKESIQPPSSMALPNLDEAAEGARRFYKKNISSFLSHEEINAYNKSCLERRKLRAIEKFREKQYNEHRLEIIEKRLLNKTNPSYNVWQDYPIDWVEIKKMMGLSFEDVIIACNCDDSEKQNDRDKQNDGSNINSTSNINSIIEEPIKNNDVENKADINATKDKIIMQSMSPSKREEVLAFARARILNSDPNFDINVWLKEKVDRIKKEEEREYKKDNSNNKPCRKEASSKQSKNEKPSADNFSLIGL